MAKRPIVAIETPADRPSHWVKPAFIRKSWRSKMGVIVIPVVGPIERDDAAWDIPDLREDTAWSE